MGLEHWLPDQWRKEAQQYRDGRTAVGAKTAKCAAIILNSVADELEIALDPLANNEPRTEQEVDGGRTINSKGGRFNDGSRGKQTGA